MLPEGFLKRMEKQLGDEYPAYLQSLERPRAVALRFNLPLNRNSEDQMSMYQERLPLLGLLLQTQPSAL